VQILAGDADYATTKKYYVHLAPEGNDGAVAKLTYRFATVTTVTK